MTQLDRGAEQVVFDSASGPLRVTRACELFSLDFPARPAVVCTPPAGLVAALGAEPREMLETKDRYFAVYDDPGIVRGLAPDMAALARSEEHTSELQSLMRISYAVFCLKKKKTIQAHHIYQKHESN